MRSANPCTPVRFRASPPETAKEIQGVSLQSETINTTNQICLGDKPGDTDGVNFDESGWRRGRLRRALERSGAAIGDAIFITLILLVGVPLIMAWAILVGPLYLAGDAIMCWRHGRKPGSR